LFIGRQPAPLESGSKLDQAPTPTRETKQLTSTQERFAPLESGRSAKHTAATAAATAATAITSNAHTKQQRFVPPETGLSS